MAAAGGWVGAACASAALGASAQAVSQIRLNEVIRWRRALRLRGVGMQILWILVWAVGCFTSPVLELFEVVLLERFRQQNPTMTGDARLGKGGKWPYAGIYARVRGLY
jgi:hypothetical protein